MIVKLRDGNLYCNRCKRNCDDACYSSCKYYKSSCTSCKYFHDDTGYCDDCTINVGIDKWEDAYEH